MPNDRVEDSPASAHAIGQGGRGGLAVVPRRFDPPETHPDGVAQRPVKVLVVGGHQLLADSLAIALDADPGLDVKGSETNASQVSARIRGTQPDVVLLSNFIGDGDCAGVVGRLTTEDPHLKVIVLTSSSDDQAELLACVQAGASGHQTTDRQATELVESIKRVHAGELAFAPDVLVSLMTRPRPSTPQRPPEAPTQVLAPRELQVLQTVATGMSTGDAASALGITVHTVRAHLKNVMTKLQAHSKLEAVIFALKRGLIELPD